MTLPDALPHRLDRRLTIAATPETVFRFFTDSARWAAWWGAGSTIDARPGGHVRIRYPNGVEVSGEVLEIAAPRRIVFTYGYEQGTPIPPGASRVTIQLEPVGDTTVLHLAHEFADADTRDHHVQGWRYQLSLFANVVADEVFAAADDLVDGWFAAWSESDGAAREAALARVASTGVRFRDRFSVVDGLDELVAQVAGFHQFMPGFRIARDGVLHRCQGTVLVDWVVRTLDGAERGRGTNVFTLNSRPQIDAVTGFWRARS